MTDREIIRQWLKDHPKKQCSLKQDKPAYDPNCIICRRSAGKADAGLSENDLCHGHLVAALREAQIEVARLREKEAIEAWNTRINDAAIRAPLVEALEQIEKEIKKYDFTEKPEYRGNTGAYVAGLKWSVYKIREALT